MTGAQALAEIHTIRPGPRWPNLLTAAVFAVLAVAILLTFRDYGISWDEEVQLPYGEKLLAYYASGLRDRSAFTFINLYLYGGFFDLVAALCNLVSPFGQYETRHLLGAVVM